MKSPLGSSARSDAIRVKIDEGMVRNKAIHIALGVRADGAKEVLGLWLQQNEGAKFWLRVMNEFKNRGVDDILLAVVDGLKGFRDAITAVFPGRSFRPASSTCRATPWTSLLERPQRTGDSVKHIYRAVDADADAAETALTAFEAGPWGQGYPAIGQSWRRGCGEVIPFFAFPDEVRRIVYTTDDVDKRDFGSPVRFFVRLQVSCFFAPPTGFPVRACRDAVKAGRCDWRHGRLRGFQAPP
ncbi:transposase [Mesorhizobium sp.]|uniref:transposase n=1 Tax=Mesorhizobium sp. TaxID=1871066 RepID=UPI0025DD51EE|nr:transposase [Mesorhizobium sp.]